MSRTSWLSLAAEVFIPTAMALGAGFLTFRFTMPGILDEDVSNDCRHSTLLGAFTSDVSNIEEKLVGNENYQRKDFNIPHDTCEEQELVDESTFIDEKTTPYTNDMTYAIELLEKQAFSQELLLKHLREGIPEWANDMIINHPKPPPVASIY